MTRFDFDSAVNRAREAELLTFNILRHGWKGATNVRDLCGRHLSYDFTVDLPGRGHTRIDSKVVQKSYTSIFWETRHEPSARAWGQDGVDMLFYWMPDPDRGYAIDLDLARPIVAGAIIQSAAWIIHPAEAAVSGGPTATPCR